MKFSIACTLISVALSAPTLQTISGNDSILARRGNQVGSGDMGAHVSDESTSTSVNSVGDSLFSGDGNAFSSVRNVFAGPARDNLLRRGIIQGLGALGGNGNSNEDSSQSTNVIAHGNQQLSGTNILNNPVLNTEGVSSVDTISG